MIIFVNLVYYSKKMLPRVDLQRLQS